MTTLLAAAMSYTRAGLSVIPCDRRAKQPRVRQWKPYQVQAPAPLELMRWFGPWSRADALAIVTGRVSGNLEVLDFDDPELYEPWADTVRGTVPDLWPRLAVVRTQSGGTHVYLRCADGIDGNRKLAVDPARPGGKFTLIETRGEGGYVLAPPSAGYTPVQGNLTTVPFLDVLERELLVDIARAFSRAPVELAPRPVHLARWADSTAERPGDDYNRRGDVAGVLERHGWRFVRQVREESFWRRPGKRRGHSATYNYRDSRYFYVFTSNAPPFDPGRAYSPFAVLALLDYGGDYRAAACELRRQGYGSTT